MTFIFFVLGNRHLTVFNGQYRVQVGGLWNSNTGRVDRPFIGVIAGVNYNGLRPLDEASDRSDRAAIKGDVQKLETIPFDFREQKPHLFTKEAMKAMMDRASAFGDGTLLLIIWT